MFDGPADFTCFAPCVLCLEFSIFFQDAEIGLAFPVLPDFFRNQDIGNPTSDQHPNVFLLSFRSCCLYVWIEKSTS